jgi:RNA polymerase sigma factor (TIGR02999 family)
MPALPGKRTALVRGFESIAPHDHGRLTNFHHPVRSTAVLSFYEASTAMNDPTEPLHAAASGDRQAGAALLPALYDELRRLAAAKLAREAPGQTLQATALVHEAWLRLAGATTRERHWNGRTHFFAAAAEVMRHILTDNARRKKAVRHGGGLHRTGTDDSLLQIAGPDGQDDELLAVHDALDQLAAHDARKAEIVKLRYFVGLSLDETAEMLGISATTAKRDWTYARAWLFREISQMKT